jgi:hypothetical protein
VLSAILAVEYGGDTPQSSDIYFTTPDPEDGPGCDCIWPREQYSILEDSLVVISDWAILKTHRLSARKVTIDVKFHNIAVTKGENIDHEPEVRYGEPTPVKPETSRQLLPLEPPVDEVVSYQVWKRKGGWKLVDPPPPRVGLKALIQAYVNDIKQDTDIVNGERQKGDEKGALWHEGFIAYSKSQLAILETLKPQ